MAGVIFKAGQILEISGVGELVEIDNEALGMFGECHPDEVAADETSAARD